MNRRIIVALAAVVGIVILVVVVAQLGRLSPQRAFAKLNSPSASSLIAAATEAEAKGNLQEAKTAYQRLINDYPNSPEVAAWQKKAEGLSLRLIFSSTVTPKSTLYTIKPGDTLIRIAHAFKTTPELIRRSNGIPDDKITPGRKVKVWTAPFSIVVDKSQNILILKSDEEIIKTYTVATGANNSTPVGTFKIINKLANPTWFKAGAVVPANSPDNILGTRWLGLNVPGYGIHGTTEPQSLGKQVTQGCVRMANPEVEELYVLVPEGTEVTIFD